MDLEVKLKHPTKADSFITKFLNQQQRVYYNYTCKPRNPYFRHVG